MVLKVAVMVMVPRLVVVPAKEGEEEQRIRHRMRFSKKGEVAKEKYRVPTAAAVAAVAGVQ
jgi:hypothetical protein